MDASPIVSAASTATINTVCPNMLFSASCSIVLLAGQGWVQVMFLPSITQKVSGTAELLKSEHTVKKKKKNSRNVSMKIQIQCRKLCPKMWSLSKARTCQEGYRPGVEWRVTHMNFTQEGLSIV